MSRFFCSVEHKALDRRMTFTVEAIDHTQAKLKASDLYDDAVPRKVGERRVLDVSATRL
jgi:hypothetical protein